MILPYNRDGPILHLSIALCSVEITKEIEVITQPLMEVLNLIGGLGKHK